MSITIEVTCDTAMCSSKIAIVTDQITHAQLAARTAGWQTPNAWNSTGDDFTTYYYCPDHPVGELGQAPIHQRVLREDCSLGKECYGRRFIGQDRALTLELYDWCGHDNLGHRMANVLIRAGYDSVLLVMAAEEADLLDLRGFGTLCFTRYRTFKESAHATS